MKNSIKTAALAALVILTAACCPCRKHAKSTNIPLAGTVWQLAQLDGRAFAAEADRFTVVFDGKGNLSGEGACNRLMGSYEASASGDLKIDRMASTRMACPDMETEARFMQLLSEATHYRIDGQMLMLLRDGELRAVLQAR
ncbi:MAG: META domain-containing protein [Alistipes sp.]|nr:META domain-containing protein [Alistipes sp.]